MAVPTGWGRTGWGRIVLLSCIGWMCLSSAASERAKPRQVHVSLTGRRGEVVVVWVTKRDTPTSSVMYWPVREHDVLLEATGHSYTYELERMDYRSPFIHTVTLSNLMPDTEYAYMCGDEQGGWSHRFTFYSEPVQAASGGPAGEAVASPSQTVHMRIGVLADSSISKSGEYTMMAMHAHHTEKSIDGVPHKRFNMLLHAGDICYADGRQKVWDKFGEGWEPLLARVPFVSALGNHEGVHPDAGLTPYLHRYPMPRVKGAGDYAQRFFSVDYGLAHVIVLDSEHRGDKQLMKQQLKCNRLKKDMQEIDRARTPWLIGMWHSPWYHTNAVHPASGKRRAVWMPYRHVLEGELDLVIAGHIHCYERTHPIPKQGMDTQHGTIHLTVGLAGNREGLYDRWKERQEWSAMRTARGYGFGVLDLYNATHMRWQMHTYGSSLSDDTVLWPTEVMDEVWVAKTSRGRRVLQSKVAEHWSSDVAVPTVPATTTTIQTDSLLIVIGAAIVAVYAVAKACLGTSKTVTKQS